MSKNYFLISIKDKRSFILILHFFHMHRYVAVMELLQRQLPIFLVFEAHLRSSNR